MQLAAEPAGDGVLHNDKADTLQLLLRTVTNPNQIQTDRIKFI